MATFGVDKLNYSAKYGSAYVETMMLMQDARDMLKTLANVSAYYASLPASTGITFSYSVNSGSYVTMTSVTNAIKNEVHAQLKVDQIGSLQIKVAFTVSANTAPSVEAIGIDFA